MAGEILSAETTVTATSLVSAASSLTAAWELPLIDLSAGSFFDVRIQLELPMANTAPGSLKAVFLLGCGWNGTTWGQPAAGSAASRTIPTIDTTALQQFHVLKKIPYNTQNETIKTNPISLREAGMPMPVKLALLVVNASGAAFGGSGQVIKYVTVTLG